MFAQFRRGLRRLLAEKSKPGELGEFLEESRKLPRALNRYRGEMFQSWVRAHGYNQLSKLDPDFAKGTKLGQKKVANTFIADELVEHKNFVQALEIKDVTVFDPRVIEQAMKMNHAIKQGANFNGKPLARVDYIFSDFNGTQLHGKRIIEAMTYSKPAIYYFNAKGLLTKL